MKNELPILPIGTVLQFKNNPLLYMIIGFNYEYKKKKYDYVAVIAPSGVEPVFKKINKNIFFFNHEEVDKVYSLGYIDEKSYESLKYNEALIRSRKSREEKKNEG